MGKQAEVSEVKSPGSVTHAGISKPVRVFTLSLDGVTVEICSIGASITKILLPKSDGSGSDDIVLGYQSPLQMHESGNRPYLGVIVGRVANRIAKGTFHLDGKDYTLAVNNDPNHLHGGNKGFSHCIWDIEIVDVKISDESTTKKGVQCTLQSPDGDQGYPGTVRVTATYTLEKAAEGVSLRLDMTAQLQDAKPSPINLAQHTYFNLAKHNEPQGVLDHTVRLECQAYTPNDATAIPTRQVVPVKDDAAMDLTTRKLIRDALQQFAVSKAGLSKEEALKHVSELPIMAKAGPASPTPGEPYGFDHNFVVPPASYHGLSLVGSLEHKTSNRQMKVFTNAPGVQLYTGNYLDGAIDPSICKEGATYGQWQGICFESQHFVSSIGMSQEEEAQFPEFSKGKCRILRPGEPEYQHTVMYTFGQLEN